MTKQAGETFDVRAFLATLTQRPGVYRMYDAEGRIVYVGKARNLQRRVSTYFQGRAADAKTMALKARIARCDVTVTRTETEALLMENELIKAHRPRFNVLLRDDKSYPYIHLSSDHEFPRLSFYRGTRRIAGTLFGPYPNAAAVRGTLDQMHRLFRVRQCQDSFFANRSRPCLQYQIKRCTAPCVGFIGPEAYARDVADARDFLEGRSNRVTENLVARMEAASARLDFESAAHHRDQIARLKTIEETQVVAGADGGDADVLGLAREGGLSCIAVMFIRGGRLLGSRAFFPSGGVELPDGELLEAFVSQHYARGDVPPLIVAGEPLPERELLAGVLGERAGRRVDIRARVRGQRARWLEMARANAAHSLAERLRASATVQGQLEALGDALGLAEVPTRVECFDISHLGGSETVASCVVFGPEGANTAQYRRFNIEGVTPGDDYAAMVQAVRRRYTRVKQGEAPMPDVLLIDGGRGQLGAVLALLTEMQVEGLTVVGVAKGHGRRAGREKLFLAGMAEALILPADSAALHLIQRVRDEAHRFAISGQRARRQRKLGRSSLESLPGLGPKRRAELLRQFGGLQGVTRAGVDDLARVRGISRSLAQRIYDHFHGGGQGPE